MAGEGMIPQRGDSFDLGSPGGAQSSGSGLSSMLSGFLSNPGALTNALGMTPEQAENVRGVLTAAGALAAHKMLAKYLGGTVAGAIGGGLAGFAADKVIKRSQPQPTVVYRDAYPRY